MASELPYFLQQPPMSSLKELCMVKIGLILWAREKRVDQLEDIPHDLKEDLKTVVQNVEVEINCSLRDLSPSFVKMCRENVNEIKWTAEKFLSFESLLPRYLLDKKIVWYDLYNTACQFCLDEVIEDFRISFHELTTQAPESIQNNYLVRLWTAKMDGRPEIWLKVGWKPLYGSYNFFAFCKMWRTNAGTNSIALTYFWEEMDERERYKFVDYIIHRKKGEGIDYFEFNPSKRYFFLYQCETERLPELCQNQPLIVMALFADWRYLDHFEIAALFFAEYLSSSEKDQLFKEVAYNLDRYPNNVRSQKWEFFLNDPVFEHDGEYLLQYPWAFFPLANSSSERCLMSLFAHFEMWGLVGITIMYFNDVFIEIIKIMLETKKLRSLRRLLRVCSFNYDQSVDIIKLIRNKRDVIKNIDEKKLMTELIKMLNFGSLICSD